MWPKKLNTSSKAKKKKVFVGLSGGVDSAVSAALLKEKGYDVTGVFIKVWHPDFLPCLWRDERRDAMRVAAALNIPFLFFDFEEEYKKGVVDEMVAEYRAGRTPNPDILCNREIKFGAFWKKAREMGADFIATGHYAVLKENIARKNALSSPAGDARSTPADAVRDVFSSQYSLNEGIDKEKDQSYFLWTLTQEDLPHIIFPVGNLEKSEVRKLAEKYHIPVADKKDSQGICFVGEVSIEKFLSHFIETKPGKVLNTLDKVIGTHRGVVFYTIGERHGFEIFEKASDAGAFYVVAKDIKSNTITVSNLEPEIIALSPTKIVVKSPSWIIEPSMPTLSARVRYRGEKIPATLSLEGKRLAVTFRTPVRGLSLGQSIVFYKDDVCLGGAVMDRVVS